MRVAVCLSGEIRFETTKLRKKKYGCFEEQKKNGTDAVQFEVEAAGVAHRLAGTVATPQRRRRRAAVGAGEPGASVRILRPQSKRILIHVNQIHSILKKCRGIFFFCLNPKLFHRK